MTLPGLVRANNLNDVVDRERAWDNLGSSLATGDISIPAPSLDLNFAANKSLVDDISGNNLITFTRASTGTFVGSNGLIQSAASGVPRFDHNPATGESLGLLVEEARTNNVLYSEQFDNAAWIKTNATVTANQATAPDGTLTMDELTDNATSGTHRCVQSFTSSVSNFTISAYVKYKNISWVYLNYFVYGCAFNIQTGVVGTPTANATSPSIISVGNGVYRISVNITNYVGVDGIYLGLSTGDSIMTSYIGTGSSAFIWGLQAEAGSFPTSYIPTVASTVTRAADLASITGASFSSWYNQSEGTLKFDTLSKGNAFAGYLQGAANSNRIDPYQSNSYPTLVVVNSGANLVNAASSTLMSLTTKQRFAVGIKQGAYALAQQGAVTITGTNATAPPTVTQMFLGRQWTPLYLNGTIARLIYWPIRLPDKALQYITQPSITAINLYAFNYVINGKDVLALNAVRNTSTRNFIFIKGLLSAAQPRLTTAAASTSSALTLATNALPKLSPTSSGNYFFASGITLSGVTTRINGTNALSIATSPFSGSTATAPLLFRELRPQANWRFTEPMPSGTIASPEFAIPFETNDFVLFMKAGPN